MGVFQLRAVTFKLTLNFNRELVQRLVGRLDLSTYVVERRFIGRDILLDWCRENIDSQLNGLLLNWYDGTLGHYISRHRDSRRNLIAGAPIVTISFGERRVFRLRPYGGKGYIDYSDLEDGTVVIMPYDTNLTWMHEVPAHKRYRGRRISVTARAFVA